MEITLVPLSWLIISIGGLSLILLVLIIRLVQASFERKKLLKQISTAFDNKMQEHMHTEETKQKLEKALLQGQKLQAIGTLAGGIAHDFNNLLYAIIGYVDMACEDTPKDSLTHKNLCKVLEAAHRGRELISRILAFSRRQHHDFKPICLKESIEGALALLKPTIPASVIMHFTTTVPSANYCIMGNQTQLHQVIVNIINNAVDAMDGEGTIDMVLGKIPASDSILEQFPAILDTSYCKIDITDTGQGMDQATLERIFEPFFTSKEVGKGTGLGLATVHAIIEEHDGKTIVTSQLGRGSTFTLLLPEYTKENADGKNSISGR